MTDPNFKNTTLLLQADNSANGAQNNTFLDSSSNNFAITRNPASGPNAPTQGTFTPFSQGWSNYFDGNGDYLNATNVADLRLGAGDFTVEAWINPIRIINTYGSSIVGTYSFISPLDRGWLLSLNPTGYLRFIIHPASGGPTAIDLISPTITQINSWSHVAVVRSGSGSNNVRLYLNGVQVAAGTTTIDDTWSGSDFYIATVRADSLSPNIGNDQISFAGSVSNFRMVKGTAVYTSAFTPPTAPLTAIANTTLLTCQSNRFIDTNTQVAAKTLTPNGNTSVQPFAPFAPQFQYTQSVIGGSAYFDGTGDYLGVTANTQFSPGANTAFTFEAWVYLTATPGGTNAQIVGPAEYAGGTDWVLAINSSRVPFFYWAVPPGGVTITSSTAVNLNSWNHIAVSRSGTGTNNLKLFVNGVNVGQATSNDTMDYTGGDLSIGADTNGDESNLTGYISGLRLINGTGYTSISVPTAPPTAITNTVLLCNFTNAGIIDGTMDNVLETVGNAQVSTSVVKYGSGSMAFDGTGDYLTCPAFNAGMNPQSGDFTIECWVWIPSLPGAEQAVVSTITTGGSGVLFGLGGGGNVNKFQIAIGNLSVGNPTVVDPNNFPVQTWTHMAAVRRAGVLSLYRNGVSVGTPTSATGTISQTTLTVGAWSTGGAPFNGYLDDVRITAGVARYLSNFTPPQVALPRQ